MENKKPLPIGTRVRIKSVTDKSHNVSIGATGIIKYNKVYKIGIYGVEMDEPFMHGHNCNDHENKSLTKNGHGQWIYECDLEVI